MPYVSSHDLACVAVNPELPNGLREIPWYVRVDEICVSFIVCHPEAFLYGIQVCDFDTSDSWFADEVHGCDVQQGVVWETLGISHQHLS